MSVMIHFILYSTTLLDSMDIFFFHTYLYYLLIHAYSSTYSCTVRVAMHSLRSHAQFAQPCTVCAAMHSSCSLAQFLHSPHAAMHSPCTVNTQLVFDTGMKYPAGWWIRISRVRIKIGAFWSATYPYPHPLNPYPLRRVCVSNVLGIVGNNVYIYLE